MTETKNNSPLQFRAPDITLQQLRDLSKKWGENRSKVIIRCIERAWINEISSQQEQTVQNKGE
jgi:predicted DNA-binding protein